MFVFISTLSEIERSLWNYLGFKTCFPHRLIDLSEHNNKPSPINWKISKPIYQCIVVVHSIHEFYKRGGWYQVIPIVLYIFSGDLQVIENMDLDGAN